MVDAKMTEANKLYSGPPVIAFSYLKDVMKIEGKSARWTVVKALRKELRQRKVVVPEMPDHHWGAIHTEMLRIMTDHPDSMEELLYEQKLKEAVVLCTTVGTMFKYLQSVYGSTLAVVSVLHDCIYLQRERRKSLCLQTE